MQKQSFIPAGGQFPVNASDLKLVKYVAMGTLGSVEKEEAAVRLILFSQEQGEFVGVPWNEVMLLWAQEAKEFVKNKPLKKTSLQIRIVRKISALFKKPEVPQQPIFSPTILVGLNAQNLINAFWELIELGLVRKEKHNEVDYFFPTPALVAKLTNK